MKRSTPFLDLVKYITQLDKVKCDSKIFGAAGCGSKKSQLFIFLDQQFQGLDPHLDGG